MNIFNVKEKIVFFLIFIITFFFIFGMKTPVGSLAQIFTATICILGLIYYNKKVIELNKIVFFLFLFLFCDLCICLLWPIIFETYDFSILKTKINLIISIFASYILGIYFNEKFSKKLFFKFLCVIFLIQSIIVFLMLINSNFSDFIMTNTKDSALVERMKNNYSGARGLGLADSAAFGFSITMGLFLLLTLYTYRKEFINTYIFFILILLGTIAAISAGRIALLGLFIGLLVLLSGVNSKRVFFAIITMFISGILILNFLINIRYSVIEIRALSTLYNFMMEPIFNYIDYGVFKSTSTDGLINMYFPLTESQFLYGDAKYSDGDSYYMGTDAGYMRFTLFYGAINSFSLYFLFLSVLSFFILKIKNNSDKVLIFCMILLSFLLHYKGEVVLLSISFNKLLFLVVFFLYFKDKSKQRD